MSGLGIDVDVGIDMWRKECEDDIICRTSTVTAYFYFYFYTGALLSVC